MRLPKRQQDLLQALLVSPTIRTLASPVMETRIPTTDELFRIVFCGIDGLHTQPVPLPHASEHERLTFSGSTVIMLSTTQKRSVPLKSSLPFVMHAANLKRLQIWARVKNTRPMLSPCFR